MTGYPFAAVVGADDAKLALILATLDRGIGGVLLRGEKGSAKSTLARGLAELLPGEAPFVDLPIGATEDRVIGSLDIAAALTGGAVSLRPGLLASADGGVLYVDEVNLLPDHLVDALLDVAASGVNRVERDGVAASHPARFVLIGSMNPEEGELRPQLLDRFGLAVDVRAPGEAAVRAEAVARRLAFDAAPASYATEWADASAALRSRISDVAGRAAVLPPELVVSVGALCSHVGAEGLRADLVICRAARALATWEGRDEVTEGDVRRVAPFALAHRARRHPLDADGIDQPALDDALDQAFGGEDHAPGGLSDAPERIAEPAPAPAVERVTAPRSVGAAPAGRRSTVEGERGRLIGDRAPAPGGPRTVAVAATVRHAASHDGPVTAADIREAVREQKAGNLVVLVVDASGSMGAEQRMEAAKGLAIGLLVDAYQRRDRVALVTFRGEDAVVALQPTGSVEVAKARLTSLPTGGRTPLAAGVEEALRVAGSSGDHRPLIVLFTDGRATFAAGGRDPVEAARAAAARVRRRGVPAVVVDVEEGSTRLGLAAELAAAMGARLLSMADLTAADPVAFFRTVRQNGRP